MISRSYLDSSNLPTCSPAKERMILRLISIGDKRPLTPQEEALCDEWREPRVAVVREAIQRYPGMDNQNARFAYLGWLDENGKRFQYRGTGNHAAVDNYQRARIIKLRSKGVVTKRVSQLLGIAPDVVCKVYAAFKRRNGLN